MRMSLLCSVASVLLISGAAFAQGLREAMTGGGLVTKKHGACGAVLLHFGNQPIE
jgi:hypothetical protein